MARIVAPPFGKSDAAKGLVGRLARSPAAVQFQWQHDVLDRGQGFDQVEGLEHETQVLSAQAGPSVLVEPGKVLAAQHDPALGGMVESGQERQQRRLARSGRTHERAGLATFEAQVDILENLKVPLGAGHGHAQVLSA